MYNVKVKAKFESVQTKQREGGLLDDYTLIGCFILNKFDLSLKEETKTSAF